MPLPKRKTTSARQGDRRSHLHLEARELVECPQCHQPALPHRVCPSCGMYDGRVVVDMEAKTKKKSDKAAKAEKAAGEKAVAPEKAAIAEKPEKVKKTRAEKPEKANPPAAGKPAKAKVAKAEKPAPAKAEKPVKEKKTKKSE